MWNIEFLREKNVVIILTKESFFELLLCIEQQHEAIIKVHGDDGSWQALSSSSLLPFMYNISDVATFFVLQSSFFLFLHLKVKKTTEIYWWYNAAKRLKCDKVVLNFTKRTVLQKSKLFSYLRSLFPKIFTIGEIMWKWNWFLCSMHF